MKVEVTLERQGDIGSGNIEWVLRCQLEALVYGKIVPDVVMHRNRTPLFILYYLYLVLVNYTYMALAILNMSSNVVALIIFALGINRWPL